MLYVYAALHKVHYGHPVPKAQIAPANSEARSQICGQVSHFSGIISALNFIFL